MAAGGTEEPGSEEKPAIVPGHVPEEPDLPTPKASNMQKATFFLVGLVMALYGGALMLAEIACLMWLVDKCQDVATGKIAEGFASLLASALAFAAGQSGAVRRT